MDRVGRQFLPTAPDIDDAMMRERLRDSLLLLAHIRIAEEQAISETRVRNLSAGGMMAELDRVIAPGTAVSIELRGVGHVTGRIAWCAERRIGIAFDRPIDPKLARKSKGASAPIAR